MKLVLILLWLTATAQAIHLGGFTGKVSILESGLRTKVVSNMTLSSDMVVITGKHSTAVIILNNQSKKVIGPSQRFRVEDIYVKAAKLNLFKKLSKL